MVRVVRLERTVSWSQTRRDTNFAIPGYSIFTIIPRREGKPKIFLSVVIYVVKAAFVPPSATGGNPANAGVARLCSVSPCPVPDTATVLPKQARYQLRYTRLFSFLSGWSYSPKSSALPLSLHPDICCYSIGGVFKLHTGETVPERYLNQYSTERPESKYTSVCCGLPLPVAACQQKQDGRVPE